MAEQTQLAIAAPQEIAQTAAAMVDTINPEQALEQAERVAKALKSFLDRKPKAVVFNGKRYPEADDWQFVGAFFKHTAAVRTTKELKDEEGNVYGYHAIADVFSGSQIVSAAEAMCTRMEKNWAAKPDFQLMSMAQTRACAKALRNVFAWVMVLAGLAPTPAEEMTGEETEGGGNQWVKAPKRIPHVDVATAVAKPAAPPPDSGVPHDGDRTITEKQQKRLFAIAKASGKTNEELREILGGAGYEHSNEIRMADYDAIVAAVEAK
jgi:hypothetical protein